MKNKLSSIGKYRFIIEKFLLIYQTQYVYTMNSSLTQEELRRYSRHLALPEVGTEGQLKLKSARVLIVGAG